MVGGQDSSSRCTALLYSTRLSPKQTRREREQQTPDVVAVFTASPEPRAGFPTCSPDAGAAGRPLAQQSLCWRFASNEGLASLFRACRFLLGETRIVGVGRDCL